MKNYSKAIAGFVAAAIVAYFGAQDGGVTGQEWLTILLAAVGGSGLVFISPKNKPAQTDERGGVDLVTALLVVFLVLVIVWFVAGHR